VKTPSLALLSALPFFVACGGEQIGIGTPYEAGAEGGGVGEGEGGSSSSGGGGPDGRPPPGEDSSVDAPITTFDSPVNMLDASVACFPGMSSGGGGSNGYCSTSLSEKCTDGIVYEVSCTCPAATCDCTAMGSGTGMGEVGVAYGGCGSSCSDDGAAWAACGYPH
jgi:hypothetical protein